MGACDNQLYCLAAYDPNGNIPQEHNAPPSPAIPSGEGLLLIWRSGCDDVSWLMQHNFNSGLRVFDQFLNNKDSGEGNLDAGRVCLIISSLSTFPPSAQPSFHKKQRWLPLSSSLTHSRPRSLSPPHSEAFDDRLLEGKFEGNMGGALEVKFEGKVNQLRVEIKEHAELCLSKLHLAIKNDILEKEKARGWWFS